MKGRRMFTPYTPAAASVSSRKLHARTGSHGRSPRAKPWRNVVALILTFWLAAPAAEAATYRLTLNEVPFSGIPTGRSWAGWMEIAATGAVRDAEISLPGLSYLYQDMQTYSLPMFGLSLNADGVLRGYLASAEVPLPAPALLFEGGYWYSGEADTGAAFACTSCLPRGTYVLAEVPAEVPLPAAALLLATPLALLAARSKRR